MTRPLKVYGITTHLGGNARGQVRAIVATTTKKAALQAMRCTTSHFNTYGDETGNALEIEVATAEPGTVFYANGDRYIRNAAEFTRWEPTRSPS
jgi:hypothetical protein